MISRALAATLFVAAVLLFVVEPLVGRLSLPVLGGAPQVWITCLLFFQVALLVGYAYAHALTRVAPRAAQPFVHGALSLAAWAALLRLGPFEGHAPASAALGLLFDLARSIGAPFVLLSATAPLVQAWAAGAGDRNPYALYAASNAGSLAGLVAYPALLEPTFGLARQAAAWPPAFLAVTGATVACGLLARPRARATLASSIAEAEVAAPTSRRARLRWLALAAVPSSLLSGVTAFVTTDVAPVPLFWALPLAAYLVAFVIPFSRAPAVRHAAAVRWFPFAVALVAFAALALRGHLPWIALAAHVGAFFVVALAAHGELARTKPAAAEMTAFYLVIAAGGALGAAFNALLAPAIFPGLWEYPLALAAAVALHATMPRGDSEGDRAAASASAGPRDLVTAALLGIGLVAIDVASGASRHRAVLVAAGAAAACAFALSQRRRPARFALLSLALVVVPEAAAAFDGSAVRTRSFFGVHRVLTRGGGATHVYAQGTTIHGLQHRARDRARVAGAYYHASGPAADVLGRARAARVGLVGLGVGSLAAYAEAGQRFVFYEIDPAVRAIAEDPALFSFLSDARGRGAEVEVVLGDARLTLARAEPAAFDLLVLDAYSSDMVPVHLLTREAFATYLTRLAPRGVMLLNVTNRYLDLGPVVAAIARDLGLDGRERADAASEADAARDGKARSRWLVLGRADAGALEGLGLGPAWTALPPPAARAWTDDRASVLGAVKLGAP